MIDVGLIGFGLAGHAFHAPVIRAVPGLRLAAILQRSGNEVAEQYPDVRIARSVEELLAMREIRLVVIATPNESHFALARQCLAAGRDVIVDKPFATTLEEATELVQFAKAEGRLLAVYQNRRYDADFQTVLQLVGGGAIGRVVQFETNYDRFRPQVRKAGWRERAGPGSGMLFDIGPHLIDHALVLFGMPQAIAADVRMERDGAVTDDAFDITLHYGGRMRALLRSSMLAAVPRPRFVLHGTAGSFIKHSFDPQEACLRSGKVPTQGSWSAEPEKDWGLLTLIENDTLTQRRVPPASCDYRDYYANVRDAVLGKAELAVTHESALDVMRVLEIARESSEARRTIPLANASPR
jgi:predicted dehydrogenase